VTDSVGDESWVLGAESWELGAGNWEMRLWGLERL